MFSSQPAPPWFLAGLPSPAPPPGRLAAPPLRAAPFVIPAGDVEDQEVWHDLRPDVTPPSAAVGEGQEPPKQPGERPKSEEGSGDMENLEIWHDLETGVTPPPGE